MQNPFAPYPVEVNELSILCRRIHNALNKQQKYLAKGKRAQVDWEAFGKSLGQDFFVYVRDSGRAATLVNSPPKHLPSDGQWPSQDQPKIEGPGELFLRGVIQVRNNIEHAGKFLTEQAEQEKKRSLDLAREALWVLREALKKHPDASVLFSGF